MFRALFLFVIAATVLAAHPLAQSSNASARRTTAPAASKPATLVNLNAATAMELATLPGIGEKTALRIIEYREKKGPFKKVEELMNVQGIGEKNFLKLKPQLTVGASGQQ